MEIIHARRSTHPRWYVPFRIRRLRCRAHGAERYPSYLLQWQTVYRVNESGTQFKMIFTPDGKMTRQPNGKAGKKSSGTWKLDTSGFCTSWKGAETNCYTVVPSGKNKWSIQKGSTAVAVWSK
jgi:hypothetical protein